MYDVIERKLAEQALRDSGGATQAAERLRADEMKNTFWRPSPGPQPADLDPGPGAHARAANLPGRGADRPTAGV
jgi:hypothetical protein